MSIRESIGIVLMGLMLGGFGWAFAVNLFGIADDLACRTAQRTRWRRHRGLGWILAGTALVIAGAASLVQALI